MKRGILKKVVCSLLSFSLVVSLIGCSSGKKVPVTNVNSVSTTAATANPKDYKSQPQVTLEWCTYQYGPVDENAPIKKKLEEMFNVKFNIWYIDGNKRDELLGVKLAAGQIPDFMTVYGDDVMLKFFNQGIIQALTEEDVIKFLPNWKKYIDSYDNNLWTYAKCKGGYMGIVNVNADGAGSAPVAWNKEWLENVGITKVPSTLNEFKDAMYKFRNNDPDKNGKKDTYGMSVTAMMNIYGAMGAGPNGLDWGVKDGKLLPYALFPEYKKALEVLQQWKKDDVIDPEWVTGENKGGYAALSHAFLNGKIGVSSLGADYHWAPRIYEGGWEGQNSEQLRALTNDKYHIVFGQPPVGPDGKFGNTKSGLKSTAYMAIGKNADAVKKQRILNIWDTIYGNYDLWKFVYHGEKDVHYTVKSDGVVVEQKDGFKKTDELAKIGAHITFTPFNFKPYLLKETRQEMTDYYQKNFFWKGAGYENMLKVALPSEPKLKNSLKSYLSESCTAIINGEKDISYYDTVMQEIRKNGGDQLIKEANEWYSSIGK